MKETETKPTRRKIQNNNPCNEEIKASMNCLMKNNNDQRYCKLVMDNALNCEKFWKFVYTDRKRRGMTPYMPPPEEREGIRKAYQHAMKEV